MIVALLIIIIIILLPGGIGFLARLWSAFIIFLGLGIAYVLFGTTGYWIMGGVCLAVFGYVAIAELSERRRNRGHSNNKASVPSASPKADNSPASPTAGWTRDRTAPVVHPDEAEAIRREAIWKQAAKQEEVKASDPFFRIASGRVVKRVLPDLEELLGQPGMVETFKTNSKLIFWRTADRQQIWQHPAGIYMAVPDVGDERLFSSMAAARDYHDRSTRGD